MLKNDPLFFEEKYEDAIRFYNSGIYQKASEILTDLVTQQPTVWQFWFSLGKSFQKQKDTKRAITSFNIALVLDDKNANTYFYLAQCYLSLMSKSEAKQALEKAIKYCEDDLLKDQILILKNQNTL